MGRHRPSFRPGPSGSAAGHRWRRWLGWLLAGLSVGLLIGFAAGLTRPRATGGFSTGDLP